MSDANPGESKPVFLGETGSANKFAALMPKGSCWYCNHPLDNIRRFCSKACADDYRIEAENFDRPGG